MYDSQITAVRPLIFRGENELNPDIRPCVSLNELRRQLNMTNIFVTVDEWAESPMGRDYATLRPRVNIRICAQFKPFIR